MSVVQFRMCAVGLLGIALVAAGCARPAAPAAMSARTTTAAADDRDPVGTRLDAFSFKTPQGRELAWDGQSATWRGVSEPATPRCLLIHAFQPDCNACQAQAKALQRVHVKAGADVAVFGLAHRGDGAAVIDFTRTLGVTYPLAVATGSEWARKWGRGDRMYIVSPDGTVLYSQEGFQETDRDVWWAVLEDIRTGRTVAFKHPQRTGDRLKTGDRLPTIELPDLMTGRPIALRGDPGRLTFVDAEGSPRACRASIGFFSRY